MARVYRLCAGARDGASSRGTGSSTRPVNSSGSRHGPTRSIRPLRSPSYRRDFWNQQPDRVQVWTEKGTVRGVLRRCSITYAVGFPVMHGFTSGTIVHNIAEDDDGRDLIVLYVGDFDPSGMFMSEEDLPTRFAKYGGNHVAVRRIALTGPAPRPALVPDRRKKKDPRYKWFVANHGRSLLGTRRHGPERSARLRRAGDRRVDRARGMATV